MNQYFEGLISELTSVKEVTAIALGGSRATDRHDETSDFDVYVYSHEPVPYEARKAITDTYCGYMELNNTFYETEDDGRLKDGIVIELIYRNVTAFVDQLKVHMEDHVAYGGYTTCFYANLRDCRILYDKEGLLAQLKEKYMSYPEPLRSNILSKNRALMSGVIPSLDDQIKKAAKRLDYPSINHRITEYLASYFDIIFAYNRVPHPGEKRMLQLAESLCESLPPNMSEDVTALITAPGKDVNSIPILVDRLTCGMDTLLKKQ